jgi:hypothetical protein
MKVEIRAEAAQFPGKEYINGIAVAVRRLKNPEMYILYVDPECSRDIYSSNPVIWRPRDIESEIWRPRYLET